MSQKAKMCKSPKNIVYSQSDKIEYENLNTNCTIVGSNNLHLVKKPQIVTSMSPAYSNPSPGYPPSPYSSPASLKSPSPQGMKPPTPQPNTYPVMQIIHNSHPVMARPMHTSQPQNVIKLKPPLNILPKPSASPQQSPKPSVSPQIVLPSNQQATIVPAPQPLMLNQMPMLAPGVQFILRPQTTKLPTQVQTPQGLILQPSGQQLLQLQPPRSQPMVRVLTNGVGLPTTTYVTHMQPQNNIQQQVQQQSTPPKKKPNKKKKQKLDLANIMKLSGIGDDDDVQFESDASQSESEHNMHSQPATPQPGPPTPTMMQPGTQVVQQQGGVMQSNIMQADGKCGPKMGNIQISAVPQAINATGTPLVQVLNQTFQGGGQAQNAQQTGIPFNPFITPNFTINNGLMVQRSGGFKLALGEDGRLVLQHDPTLNQDLQSQLLLQSIFGLNGGLVLQPSIDQQIHSQTVQTIQQQSVQTIQQQTVQSQTIQTVQHQIVQPQTLQSIQSQIQGQIQSLLQQQNLGSQSIAIQPQNITIQPQGMQGLQVSQPISIQSQPIAIHSQSQPITIQAQSQPITIQSQSHQQPISLHNNVASQSQIINLSQANQVFTGNSVPQTVTAQSLMHIQPHSHSASTQSPNIPQVQVNNQPTVVPASTQSSPALIHHQPQQQSFTQASIPNVPTSQGNLGTQPILKVQPFQKAQPPVQTVHPIHHQNSQQHQHPPPPTSYVVNLTPEQLEQLKRNGQLTVNGQTIFMQRHSKVEETKKTSPKIKPIKKVSKIPTVMKDNKAVNNLDKTINNVVKESVKTNMVSAMQSTQKNAGTQASVQTQVTPTPKPQPAAIIQPSIQPPAQLIQSKIQIPQPKVHVMPSMVQASTNTQPPEPPAPAPAPPAQEVDRFLGQLIEEPHPPAPPPAPVLAPAPVPSPSAIVINQQAPVPLPNSPAQRVHTIQLTPQKQQHLKSIQVQIQTLSARLTPGNTEMQNALKLLFQEQQKILATGKLLPPEKVFYHNNQLIVNNSIGLVKNEVISPPTRPPIVVTTSSAPSETLTSTTATSQHTINLQTVPTSKLMVPITTSEVAPVPSAPVQKVVMSVPAPVPVPITQPQPPQTRYMPLYTKAQLIEQQLNTDQNGAVKPDIHTPFKDKADACKRLIRYHCFDQPVLSQKDLNKADEIFELTARHFIDKFGRMVDKYRYLLHKESQRHVQTSELMMLDRMFLSEEQQSLMRLRQEIEECNLEMQQAALQQQNAPQPPPEPCPNTEEYDEWACIQRELGCLPLGEDGRRVVASTAGATCTTATMTTSTMCTTTPSTGVQPVKRSSSADSRLETLKKFRVDKHCKKSESAMVVGESGERTPGQPHFVQASSFQNTQTVHASNNVHCSTVLSSSSIVHGTTSIQTSSTNYGNETNTLQTNTQRTVLHTGHTSSNIIGRTIIGNGASCTVTSNRAGNASASSLNPSSRTSSTAPAESNGSNTPTNTSGNGNMLHNMHNSLHSYNSTMHIQNPMQHGSSRVHSMSVHPTIHHQNLHPLQHVVHNSTHQSLLQRGVHNVQQYSTQHIVQHITHTVHHTQQIQNSLHGGSVHSQNSVHHSSSVHSQNSYSSGNEELDNNDSIDEQVQSAIDSILNLQQNTSLELDETMQNMLS